MNSSEMIRVIARSEAQQIDGSFQYGLTTTDDTPTVIATIEITDYFGGKLKLELVAVEDSGADGSLAAEQIVRFWKAGTLTLGTPAPVFPLETDITGATFSVSVVSDNIEISVTGVASKTINWVLKTEVLQTNANPAAP